MKELNIENFNLFAKAKKEEYFKKVKSGEISYKKLNAFLNEFQLKSALIKLNYSIRCYNDAAEKANQHYMTLFKKEFLIRLKNLKSKIQKWN